MGAAGEDIGLGGAALAADGLKVQGSLMELHLAPARESDGDTLVSLAREFHREDGHVIEEAGETALIQITQGEPFARAGIAWQESHAVGYVVITLGYSVEYGRRDGFIDDLYLVPAVRGQGLGRKLLDFALARAAELGIRTLHLEVEAGNASATRLYRSVGFAGTGRNLMGLTLRNGGRAG